MTSQEVYQIMLYACAKSLQQGYLSPSDFNTTINIAQKSYLDYLLGEYQKYQIQRPVAVVEFGQNERVRDSMAPLIYNTLLAINSTTGISPFPSDYEYVDAMFGQYGFYNIRFIQQDRLDAFVHSSIDPIADNPAYIIQKEGFRFFPETIGSARMYYVRQPPPIIWGYTLDSNGIPVWNPATSQNPIWSDTDTLQVIVRALALVGVSLQFNTVLGYAQEIKTNGQ